MPIELEWTFVLEYEMPAQSRTVIRPPLCPESRAKPAGQRPTAPSGGRFRNVSMQNCGGRGWAIKRVERVLLRPPGGRARPSVATSVLSALPAGWPAAPYPPLGSPFSTATIAIAWPRPSP
jgi:hypothetical protein